MEEKLKENMLENLQDLQYHLDLLPTQDSSCK